MRYTFFHSRFQVGKPGRALRALTSFRCKESDSALVFEPIGLVLEGAVEVWGAGFEMHGHGIRVGYGSVEDDITGLGYDRIVVVRVEPVPSALLKAAAVVQAIARRVKALDGREGVGRIDPSRAGLGE